LGNPDRVLGGACKKKGDEDTNNQMIH
jgi:hypothetical protein